MPLFVPDIHLSVKLPFEISRFHPTPKYIPPHQEENPLKKPFSPIA